MQISISSLKPSQYRSMVKGWDKKKYENEFAKFSGDRKKYRIYIPLSRNQPLQHKIVVPHQLATFLLDKGYEVDDYVAGVAKDIKTGARRIRIGKLLTKDDALKALFDNDVQRKSTKIAKADLMIVISRHPYDIAGMSTDRGWTSCQNLVDGEENQYVPTDIKAGSLVAYVVALDDLNIRRPTCRTKIIRYVSKDNPGHFLLRAAETVYGTEVPGFKNAVKAWCDTINTANGFASGSYHVNSDLVYLDDEPSNAHIIGPDLAPLPKGLKRVALFSSGAVREAWLEKFGNTKRLQLPDVEQFERMIRNARTVEARTELFFALKSQKTKDRFYDEILSKPGVSKEARLTLKGTEYELPCLLNNPHSTEDEFQDYLDRTGDADGLVSNLSGRSTVMMSEHFLETLLPKINRFDSLKRVTNYIKTADYDVKLLEKCLDRIEELYASPSMRKVSIENPGVIEYDDEPLSPLALNDLLRSIVAQADLPEALVTRIYKLPYASEPVKTMCVGQTQAAHEILKDGALHGSDAMRDIILDRTYYHDYNEPDHELYEQICFRRGSTKLKGYIAVHTKSEELVAKIIAGRYGVVVKHLLRNALVTEDQLVELWGKKSQWYRQSDLVQCENSGPQLEALVLSEGDAAACAALVKRTRDPAVVERLVSRVTPDSTNILYGALMRPRSIAKLGPFNAKLSTLMVDKLLEIYDKAPRTAQFNLRAAARNVLEDKSCTPELVVKLATIGVTPPSKRPARRGRFANQPSDESDSYDTRDDSDADYQSEDSDEETLPRMRRPGFGRPRPPVDDTDTSSESREIMKSKSNGVTRRRARKSALDRVDGNHLIKDDPQIVQRVQGDKMRRGGKLADADKGLGDDLESTSDEENAEVGTISEVSTSNMIFLGANMKKIISVSADVIFVPYTQTTQYSARRSAKMNLERRMPGCKVRITDVSGEGQVDFEISTCVSVEDQDMQVVAHGIASPFEMAIHTAVVTAGDRTFNVDPVDKARSPEATLEFLRRMVTNVSKTM